MADVEVQPNPFEGSSYETIREELARMAGENKAIFDAHKNPGGETRYEDISADDADTIRENNVKMAFAREVFEPMQKLRSADTQSQLLSDYMNAPVQLVPQPATPQAETKSLGEATHAAWLARGGYKDGADWSFEADVKRYTAEGTKTVLGTDSALAGVGSQYPPESVREGTIVETLYQPHNIAPMIPQVGWNQNAIPYMAETVTAEGAAETAEGALGAEAQIDWAESTEPVRKITVLQPVTEELLADENGMRAIIDGRLRQFMGNREDLQLLTGDGVAPNLEGILNRTGVQNTNYSLTGASAQGLAEAALSAANLVRTAFQTPSAYTMRVGTWEYIRLAQDSQNNYLFAGPADQQTPRLWGLPVVTNENMDNYTTATDVPILVGDWSGAATIFRRQGVTVQVSDSHDDRFARGVLTIRLLERLGLVVWRAAGFSTVTRTA